MLELKPGSPEFKSLSDHQLDLFQVVLGSAPAALVYRILKVVP